MEIADYRLVDNMRSTRRLRASLLRRISNYGLGRIEIHTAVLAALLNDIERLGKALEPFAVEAGEWPREKPRERPLITNSPNDEPLTARFTFGDLERARDLVAGRGF